MKRVRNRQKTKGIDGSAHALGARKNQGAFGLKGVHESVWQLDVVAKCWGEVNRTSLHIVVRSTQDRVATQTRTPPVFL